MTDTLRKTTNRDIYTDEKKKDFFYFQKIKTTKNICWKWHFIRWFRWILYISILTSDASDVESFSIDYIIGFEELDKEPEEGDFVIVKFSPSGSKQKK